ncbi:PEP-CTERM sorting domain-containing protein [Paucibacter sediminis]|uniref:PEP-CTERM sorting domain-containing protein n=1 Tax=Paucibacter sediminis TaxID=3019553 RepID=A0AA95NHM1_9BURK|nr:PEP-CTERM sorting domain-containing protein [Paucibacter sp. S2-9]WIT13262.1 PEP-CTERM sorting domain-containing protein [Paucibacter sp. S2-9]
MHLYGRLALTATLVVTGSMASAATYSTTLLDTLGGSFSSAAAINNAGQIVGVAYTPGNVERRATRWSGSSAIDLGTLGGTDSWATDINDAGQVVGAAFLTGNTGQRATLWNGTQATDLGVLGGASSSLAYAINNAGQVVGSSYIAPFAPRHAVVWNGATITDLGSFSGPAGNSWATGINDLGQIVGGASGGGSPYGAFVWNGGAASFLSVDLSEQAKAINNLGQVTGVTYLLGDGTLHGVVWSGAATIDLPPLAGMTLSRGNAINNAGQVVGDSEGINMPGRATLWVDSKAIDLNTFLDPALASAGWVLETANGINDSGSVVGRARNVLTEQYRGYLLAVTAVPEPSAYVLMLLGLAGLALLARNGRLAGEGCAKP